jgi:hemolysin activation/secretion protein
MLPPLLSALLLVGSGAAAAAVPPPLRVPDSGTTLREAQSARPTPPPRREGIDPLPAAPPAAAPADEGPTLLVRGFRLENVEPLDEAEIQRLLEPYRGRELTMRQLEEAVHQITERYRQRGYPVARAYLPRQQAEDGILVIRILIGAYGPASLENDSLVRDPLLAATLSGRLKEGQPVRRADLERAVLLIGDLPGAGLPRLSMGPGQQPGSTDFFAQVPAGPRAGGYLMSDNQGSRYTGRWRFGAGGEINSPLGYGDQLSLFGLTTRHQGLAHLSAHYAFPLGADGLRLNLGYSHVEYELGGEFRAMDAFGEADTVEAAISYPLIRSAAQNLNVGLNLAHRRTRDDYRQLDAHERGESTLGRLTLRHETWNTLFGRPLYARSGGAVSFGRHRVRSNEEGAADFRHTAGDFGYLSLDFLARLEVAEHWSLHLSASGQQAFGKNLDSSEQFSVSGAHGVKAYRETISGDNGYLLNAELRYRLPGIGGLEHSLGAFVDHGGWSYEKAPYPEKRSDHLTDIGLGYYLNRGPFSLKAQVAHGLGSYPAELKKESDTICTVLLTLSF